MRYTTSHEWCRVNDGVAECGISKHAAEQLNDLTFVDLTAQPGDELEQGAPFGEVESVKTTSDVYAPVSGTVEAVNERFQDEGNLPGLTDDPEGADSWLIKIKVADPSQLEGLLDAAGYAEHCASE